MSEARLGAQDKQGFNDGVSAIADGTGEELGRSVFVFDDEATSPSVNSSTGNPFEDRNVPPAMADGTGEELDNPFENVPEGDGAGVGDDTTESVSPTNDSENESTEEVGLDRTNRLYEKLGSMLPPEGSVKRGLKNFMITAGAVVGSYFANKYGDDVLDGIFDGLRGIVDGAEWLAREGADLVVSIGSAAWEGAQGIAGAVKNVASNVNPVYFGAGVANGVMRGAIDSDPANDNKKNLITGAVMGAALAHGANPGAPEAVSFAAGHLVGSKGRKLVSAAGRAASGAATKFSARRLSDSGIQSEEGVVMPVAEQRLESDTSSNVNTDNRAEGVKDGTEENQNADVPAVDTTPKPSRIEARRQARSDRRAARTAALKRGRATRKGKPSVAVEKLADSV